MNSELQTAYENYIAFLVSNLCNALNYQYKHESIEEANRLYTKIETLKNEPYFIYTVIADFGRYSDDSYRITVGVYDNEVTALEEKAKYEAFINRVKEYNEEWYYAIDSAMFSLNANLDIFSEEDMLRYNKIHNEVVRAEEFNFCKIEQTEINKTLDYMEDSYLSTINK